jgi:Flp pilus assembly pilin Flp
MWVGRLYSLWRDEEGQDLIEWSLLLAFIALVSVGVLSSLQPNYMQLWSTVSNGVAAATAALR